LTYGTLFFILEKIPRKPIGEKIMKRTIMERGFVFFLIFTIGFACSRSGDPSRDVEVPELKKTCLSGRCVKGQFETAYQRFAVVTGSVVNIRPRPDVTSRILAQLPVTRKITVLHVNPIEITIGGIKGRWAFVQDTENISLRGWLFDHFIGYTDCFVRPEQWRIREIRVILKGMLTVYACTPDCRFEIVQNEKLYKKDGKKMKDKVTGTVLQCKNVIWMKKDKPDDYPVFFTILKDGKLDLADQYRDMRGVILVK
jgi:hypothetical protein